MDTLRIYNIFKEIMSDNSKTYKENTLKKYKDDEEFKKVLSFLLNPYIVTGISTKKMNKKIDAKINAKALELSFAIDSLDGLIRYLQTNKSGRDIDICIIQNFINVQSLYYLKEFIKGLATKSLKIGVTAKTVNKVYGKNTIDTFEVQLAESYAKKSDKITGEFAVTLKLDGNRVIAMKENDKVNFFSRAGQPIEGLNQLEEHMKPLPNGFVYDGELLLVNDNKLNSADLFRATQKVVRKDGIKENLEFYIFDTLTIKEFKDGKSKNTYRERRKKLNEFDNKVEESQYVYILHPLYQGSDKSVIGDLMSKVISDGYEGLMINTLDGKYQTKRTTDLQKVKEFHSADLLCVGVEEGKETGKFKNTLGSVLVEYKGNIVGAGFGDTNKMRDFYWKNQNEIIGKIVEITFFEETKDEKTELPSLRFPVFKTIRHDKTIDDINYEG